MNLFGLECLCLAINTAKGLKQGLFQNTAFQHTELVSPFVHHPCEKQSLVCIHFWFSTRRVTWPVQWNSQGDKTSMNHLCLSDPPPVFQSKSRALPPTAAPVQITEQRFPFAEVTFCNAHSLGLLHPAEGLIQTNIYITANSQHFCLWHLHLFLSKGMNSIIPTSSHPASLCVHVRCVSRVSPLI